MQQVRSIVDIILVFDDDCPELLILDSRDCMHESVVETVMLIETPGGSQYQIYVVGVTDNWTVSIQDTIKKNSLPLFSSPKPKL